MEKFEKLWAWFKKGFRKKLHIEGAEVHVKRQTGVYCNGPSGEPWDTDITVEIGMLPRCVLKIQSMEIDTGFNLGVREKEMSLTTSKVWA